MSEKDLSQQVESGGEASSDILIVQRENRIAIKFGASALLLVGITMLVLAMNFFFFPGEFGSTWVLLLSLGVGTSFIGAVITTGRREVHLDLENEEIIKFTAYLGYESLERIELETYLQENARFPSFLKWNWPEEIRQRIRVLSETPRLAKANRPRLPPSK